MTTVFPAFPNCIWECTLSSAASDGTLAMIQVFALYK